jgi:hypothetical protein
MTLSAHSMPATSVAGLPIVELNPARSSSLMPRAMRHDDQ